MFVMRCLVRNHPRPYHLRYPSGHAHGFTWTSPNGRHRRFSTSVATSALKTGIVGLPNVGKSTLFNAIVKNGAAQAANFPFCTIEPNTGIVTVPDERLQVLADISKAKKIVPTIIEFVDIAGLVKGASKGEGLGNQFLANIRECESIIQGAMQVVRCFEDDNVVHVSGRVNPEEDIDVINFELALADVAQIEKRLQRMHKGRAKSSEEKAMLKIEQVALEKISGLLDNGKAARAAKLTPDEQEAIKHLKLLTMKPLIYAANVAEDELAAPDENEHVQVLRRVAESHECDVVIVSAQVEAELNQLDEDEAKEYLQELGVLEGGLHSLIKATYRQLGLLTYFTSGEKETRAWTFLKGMTAPQCAGIIHSDFEKQFIRAETVSYADFVKHEGFAGAKAEGLLRAEGKEYVVSEGDVLLFRTGA